MESRLPGRVGEISFTAKRTIRQFLTIALQHGRYYTVLLNQALTYTLLP